MKRTYLVPIGDMLAVYVFTLKGWATPVGTC